MAGRRGVKNVKKSSIPGVTITQFVENIPKGCSVPDFERKPITLTLQEGKNAIFRAVVKGQPKPEVLWKRSNREMDDPQKYQVLFSPGTNEFIMQINKITVDDSDMYRCTAVNEYGEATCVAGLKIIQVGFRKKTQEHPTTQGDLKKEIQDFRKGLKKLAPSTAPKKEIDMEQVWQLLLNADRKDYERICLKYGIVDYRGMLRKLQEMKKEREDKQAQYVYNITNLRHVKINKPQGYASFGVEMELKHPDSRIYLYKDGQMINFGLNSENFKHCLKHVGKKYKFIINNPQPEDAGVYQIKVEDVVIFSTELEQEGETIPTSFRSPLGEVRCKEQDNAVFQCTLYDACFKAVWLHKNHHLQPNDKYDISVSGDGLIHRLIIKNVQSSDQGTYTIDIGTRTSSAWLEVESAAKGKRKQAEGDIDDQAGWKSKLSEEDGAKKLRSGEGHEDQNQLADFSMGKDSQYMDGQRGSREFDGSLRKDGSLEQDMFTGANRDGKWGEFSRTGIDMAEGSQFGRSGGQLDQNAMLYGTGGSGEIRHSAGVGALDGKDTKLGGIGSGTGFGPPGLQALQSEDFTLNGSGIRDGSVGLHSVGESEEFYDNKSVRHSGPGARLDGVGDVYGGEGLLGHDSGSGAGFGSARATDRLYGTDSMLGGVGTGSSGDRGTSYGQDGMTAGGGAGTGSEGKLYGRNSTSASDSADRLGSGLDNVGGLYRKDGILSGVDAGIISTRFDGTVVQGGLYGQDGALAGDGTGRYGDKGGTAENFGKDGTGRLGAGTGVGGIYGSKDMLGKVGSSRPGGKDSINESYGKDGMLGGISSGRPGPGTNGAGGVARLYGEDTAPAAAGTGAALSKDGLYGKGRMLVGAGMGGPDGLYGKDILAAAGTGEPGASGGRGGLYGTGDVIGGAGFRGSADAEGIAGQYGKDGMLAGVGFGGSAGAEGTAGHYGKDGMLAGAGFGGSAGAEGMSGRYGKDGTLAGAGFGGSAGAGGMSGRYAKDGTLAGTGFSGTAGAEGTAGHYGKDGTLAGAGFGGSAGAEGMSGHYGKDGTLAGAGFGGSAGAGGMSGCYDKDGTLAGAGFGGSAGAEGMSGQYGKDGTLAGAGFGGSAGAEGMSGRYGKDGTLAGAGFGGSAGAGGMSGRYGKDGTLAGAGFGGSAGAEGTAGCYGKDGTLAGAGFGGSAGAGGMSGRYGKDGTLAGAGFGGSVGGEGMSGRYGKDGMPPGSGFGGSAGAEGMSGRYGKDGTLAGADFGGSAGADGTAGHYGKDGTLAGAGFGGSAGAEGTAGHYGKDGMPPGSGFGGSAGAEGMSGRYGRDGMPPGAGFGGSRGNEGISGHYGKDERIAGECAGRPHGAREASGLYGKDGMLAGGGGAEGIGGHYGKYGLVAGGGIGDAARTGRFYGKDGMLAEGVTSEHVDKGGPYGKDDMLAGAGVGGTGGTGGHYGKDGILSGTGMNRTGGVGGEDGLYGKDGQPNVDGADGSGFLVGDRHGTYGKKGVFGGTNAGAAGTGFGDAGSTGGFYGMDGKLGGIGLDGIRVSENLHGKDDVPGGAGAGTELRGPGRLSSGSGTDAGFGGQGGMYGKDGMISGTGAGRAGVGLGGTGSPGIGYRENSMLHSAGNDLADIRGHHGKNGILSGVSASAGLGGSGGTDGETGFGSAGSPGSSKGDMLGRVGARFGAGSSGSSMADGAGGISARCGEAGDIDGLRGKDGMPAGARTGSGAGTARGASGKDGTLGGSRLGTTGSMHGHYGDKDGMLYGTSAGLASVSSKDGIQEGANTGAGLGGSVGKGGLLNQYGTGVGAHASTGQSGEDGMGDHPRIGARLGAEGVRVGKDFRGSDANDAELENTGNRRGYLGEDGVLGRPGLGDRGTAGSGVGKDALQRAGNITGSEHGGTGSPPGLFGKDGRQGIGSAGLSCATGMKDSHAKVHGGADGDRLTGPGGTNNLYGQGDILRGSAADALDGTAGLYDQDSMRGRAGSGLRGSEGTRGRCNQEDYMVDGTGASTRFGDGYDKEGIRGGVGSTGFDSDGGIGGLYCKDGRLTGTGAPEFSGEGGMASRYGRQGARDFDGSLYEKTSDIFNEEFLSYGQSSHLGDARSHASDRRRQLSDLDTTGFSADTSRSRDRKGRGGSLLEEDVREPHCRFDRGLLDVHAQKGKPAVLSCRLNNEHVEGTWFKDGFKITSLGGVSVEKEGPVHKLIIDEVQDSHAGKYKFEVEGIRTEASVFVEDPPSVDAALLEKLRKEPIVVKAGKNAIVKIPFGGRKPIRASWLKDEGELLDDARIQTDHSDNFTRLSISSTSRKDCGDYKVKLRNESGGLDIYLKLIVIDKPQAPMGPIVVVDSSTSGITIQWKPPKDDGGKPVLNYIIERQQVGRKTWLTLGETSGNTPTFTTSKVEHDKSYYFRVKAVNAEGTSEPLESDEVMAAAKVFPGAPAPPKILRATKGSITLSWAVPRKTGNSRILGYSVEKCKKGSNSWTPVTDLPITDRKYTVTDLKEGLQYEFRVAAINAAGTGEPSAPSEAVFARDPMKPPGPVRDLKVVGTDYTSITLSWMPPESEEGSSAQGYVVEMRNSNTLKWTQCNPLPIAMTTYIVRQLKPRDVYFLRVTAVNDGGLGDSVELDRCIQAVPPTVYPRLVIHETVKSFMIVKAGNTIRVRIPFEASPPPQVIWLKDGLSLPAKATTATREGLTQLIVPGAEFSDGGHYDIILQTEQGKKETFSFLVQVIDIPQSPGPILLVENVPDTVTLTWEPSPTEKRESNVNYMVMKRDSCKGSWEMVADLIYTNKCTVTDLIPRREYYFRVLAKNYMGMSEPSETVQPWSIQKTKGKYEVRLPKYRGVNQSQPPRFLVQLKPHVVTLGFDCYISCAVTGYPVPQITWYKDGRDLSQDSAFFCKNDFGVCSLVIPGVTASDGGLYMAVASNELGQAISKATVDIKGSTF